jgi:pimeloyl-ACP methyl ester carboxylesterase
VVVAPGAGLVGLDYLNIHDRVADFTTAVLYDRAGTGWSDQVDLPRTATAVAGELRSLLRAAGVPVPYLLVGHSLGGAYVRRYAQRFPDEVAGLLLLDPAHEDYPAYMPERVRKVGEQARNQPMSRPTEEQFQYIRYLFEQMLVAWPDPIRELLIQYHLASWQVGLHEGQNMNEILDELRHGGAVSDVPVIVLTAMGLDPGQRLFMSEELLLEQNDAKRELYAVVAASFPRGEHRVLQDAAHSTIHIDCPDAVLAAIRDIVDRLDRCS